MCVYVCVSVYAHIEAVRIDTILILALSTSHGVRSHLPRCSSECECVCVQKRSEKKTDKSEKVKCKTKEEKKRGKPIIIGVYLSHASSKCINQDQQQSRHEFPRL